MSCKAAESIEDAVLRMARVNSNKKISVRKDRDEMSVQLLDKTRKINKLLHNNSSSKVVFNDICEVLTEILLSNVLVISRKGKILGVSECEGVEEITELISDKVGGYIDPLLNERLLGVLSTKENVNLETLGFGSEVKRRILLGTFVLSADCYDSYYKKALQARARLKAAFDAVFQRYDLLLTPVAPTTAPRLGEGLADPLSLYLSDIYTVPANLAGLPALSMPCGFDRSGLPIGAQLIGPALGDLAVLDAAHAYQQETDWHRRHPDTPASAKGGDAL